ncbi:hypothetical protein DsansV1_C07g0075671 [Dioscorea sansibarensis]
MAKEFNVQPVVFPTSSSTPAAVPHQRRATSAPFASLFQPPGRATSTSLPFMSFDIGAAPAPSSFLVPTFPSAISAS